MLKLAHEYSAFRALALATLALALLAAGGLAVAQIRPTSAATPSLELDVPAEARVGEPIEIGLIVRNANDISGYQTDIRFDTSVAHLRGLSQRNNDLKKLGRDVHTLGPIQVPGGVVVGAYTCPFNDCTDTAGKPKQEQGGRGTVRLATIAIVADQPGPLTIQFAAPLFVDTQGFPIADIIEPVTVTITIVED